MNGLDSGGKRLGTRRMNELNGMVWMVRDMDWGFVIVLDTSSRGGFE